MKSSTFKVFLIVPILNLGFLCLRTSPRFLVFELKFLKLGFIVRIKASGIDENRRHKGNDFTLKLLQGKKKTNPKPTYTFRTFSRMVKVMRGNGCCRGKGLSLFCSRLRLSDWVIEILAGKAEVKFVVPVEKGSFLLKGSPDNHHVLEGLREA